MLFNFGLLHCEIEWMRISAHEFAQHTQPLTHGHKETKASPSALTRMYNLNHSLTSLSLSLIRSLTHGYREMKASLSLASSWVERT
jgi:hypothetical protein